MTSHARLGPQYQMPLGNPDGASTNPASRTKFLINQRAQYVISYNGDTHQANWVGWSYSLADDGNQARTDAWAKEELLPSGYLQIGTATFGTGWDRGHMTPSADRTKDLTNNQVTFRMSNIIPQASQNNQGLWANFEDYCRSLAADGDEVVIISGPGQFTGSRLNNQMSIPGSVWKIAVEIPNANSTTNANERITTSARVIALLTPNTSTGLGPWQSYITSVEQIEDVTGFNFFTAITNQSTAIYLKNLVDTGTGPNNPTVVTTFNPSLGAAGTTVTISGFNFGTSPLVQFNGSAATVLSATANSISAVVPAGATSGYITVQGAGGTDTSYEPFTVSTAVVPTLSLTPSSLSGLTANQGSPGAAAPYALTGSNLTNSVTVTAPANFEVSKDGGTTFTNSLTLSNDITGALGAQLLARIKAGAPAGNVSGTITHASGGATTANLAITGSVLSTDPNMSVSTNSITGLTAPQNSAGTTSKSYLVSGANLTGSISISAPAGFEVSTNNISFGSSATLAPSSGSLSNAPVHVRVAASGTAGPVSGTITHSGGGLTSAPAVSVSGNVTSTAPSLVLSTNAISGLTAVQNNPGGSKAYDVSGTFLTGTISVGAPAGFEIGTNTTTFGSSLVLSPSSGTLPTTTIYARLASSATTGAKSGNITHSGGGAVQTNASVSGTVNAPGSGGVVTNLARWNFDTLTTTTVGTSYGPLFPNEGVQTNLAELSGLHVTNTTSYTLPVGNGSPKSLNANNWTTNDYYQFKVSMAGYRSLKLRFDQTASSTGPAQFQVAYSTNGTSFITYTNYDVPKTNGTAVAWSNSFSNAASTVSLDLSALTNLDNSADVYLRILPRSTVSMVGSTVGTNGTSRIDNVTIEATTTGAPVDPKPVITSAGSASGTAYSSFQYQITADNAPTYFNASGLPAGLSINNATGLIAGSPTVSGSFSILLTASNGNGDGTKTLTLNIAAQPAPVITSATTATAAVNASFSYQITADNSPTGFDATGLPAGLSVDTATGSISGTPTTTGTNNVTLSASNAAGTGTAVLTLTVEPDPNAPIISGPFTVTGAVGTLFNYQITANNSPTTYLATGLPAGLTVDPVTGQISGTPTTKGTSTVMIMVSNGSGSDTKTLTITILEPLIEVSQTDLSFTASFGLASEAQSYTLTGSDIASPVTVLAPGNFEVSDNNGSSYFDELTVAPAPDGTLNVAITVRMKSSAPLGESSGGIIHSGADAAPKYVNLTGFSDVTGATMDLSATSLTGFTTKTGVPSFVQSYTLTGTGLSSDVVVTAPAGYQVSADNTTFAGSIVVSPDATGTVAAKEIFVRMLSATAGTFNGSISHIGGGAEDKYLAVSGTVIAPSGPPIISPLSGSAYTNASFSTKIMASGSLIATNFGATSLPGTLTINTTNGVISGNVPSFAGTNIFGVSATTQDGTTTTNYNLRVVSATQQNSVPTSVVINKFQNGLPDRIELLVIGDTNDTAPGPPIDMRGMTLKDFSASRSTDEGGEYRFAEHEVWSKVKAGTLIVVSAGTQSTEDLDAADFVLRVNLGSASLFKQESPNFDIDDLDMVMIKPASMGVEGFAGGIHAMAAGRISGTTIYGLYTGKKIRSDQSLNSSRNIVYATASSLLGYNSTDDKAALAGSGLEFGTGNTTSNRSYITSLRNLDQTPPVITVNGLTTVNLVVGQTYTEQGATVSGGTSSTASVSGSVNTNTAGTYIITYTASDLLGNIGTATRTVIVGKATPTITSAPTASSIIAGQKLSASTLTGGSASVPGTFAWTDPNQLATLGSAVYGVTFTPTDTANYNSTTTTVSVVANQSTAFEAWATGYNLSGANAQLSSDPDGDGWSNAQEFAFGRNPAIRQSSVTTISLENGTLRAVFLAHKDVTYTVRSTSDLTAGFAGTISIVESADQSDKPSADYKRMEATLPASAERAFLRVEAILP